VPNESKPSGGGHVAADAQFTNARVLKPFAGFEEVYQGESHAIPIAFPGTLDAQAGDDGMAPNLLAGAPIPFGSRVLVWIPVAVFAPNVSFYEYRFVWRLRNVRDFRTQRTAFHFPRQSPGAPDSTVPPAQPRFVIPAASDVVIYEQAEPAAGSFLPGVMRVLNQAYRIGDGGGAGDPFLPPGSPAATGIYQQGVLDPATAGAQSAGDPIFQPLWMDAAGDELIVLVTPQDTTGNWDFTNVAEDLPFSNIYGDGNGAHAIFRDVGIYLFTGTNP
jgi:hypothetical protein